MIKAFVAAVDHTLRGGRTGSLPPLQLFGTVQLLTKSHSFEIHWNPDGVHANWKSWEAKHCFHYIKKWPHFLRKVLNSVYKYRYYIFTSDAIPIFEPWISADTDISTLVVRHTYVTCFVV